MSQRPCRRPLQMPPSACRWSVRLGLRRRRQRVHMGQHLNLVRGSCLGYRWKVPTNPFLLPQPGHLWLLALRWVTERRRRFPYRLKMLPRVGRNRSAALRLNPCPSSRTHRNLPLLLSPRRGRLRQQVARPTCQDQRPVQKGQGKVVLRTVGQAPRSMPTLKRLAKGVRRTAIVPSWAPKPILGTPVAIWAHMILGHSPTTLGRATKT